MQRLGILFSIVLATWIGLFAAGPSFAAGANLTTPEGAISAYIDGVAHRDFNAIIAVTSANSMSKGFDFVAHVDRLRALTSQTPAPASDPLFIEINKATFMGQIARQIQFLAYGLMTTREILNGNTVLMDASEAAEFESAVRADRLAGLTLVKVGIPSPTILNSEKHQANAAKLAKIYGADASTERLALVSFEGLDFEIGFSLLRYGDNWTVMSQSSPIAGTNTLGTPMRVTQEAFDEMLK